MLKLNYFPKNCKNVLTPSGVVDIILKHSTPNLDPGALYALRHICLAEDAKLFNFTLTDQSQRRLGRVCEQYVAAHLDYQPKSLEFLHGVLE